MAATMGCSPPFHRACRRGWVKPRGLPGQSCSGKGIRYGRDKVAWKRRMRISEPYWGKKERAVPCGDYGLAEALPMASHVTPPSWSAKSMPLTVAPSRPTALAGTESFTHWPAAGRGPAL